MTIQASDLPHNTDAKAIVDTDSFAGWTVIHTEDDRYYAQCELYDMFADDANEMATKLNQLGGVIVGWE
jgi:hypothetical protein